jgi:hypothetical protein
MLLISMITLEITNFISEFVKDRRYEMDCSLI